MLLTIALIAVFTATLLGTCGVLLDSAVRGWNAFVALRKGAGTGHDSMPLVRLIDKIAVNRLPEMRTANPGRYAAGTHAPRTTRRRLSAAA